MESEHTAAAAAAAAAAGLGVGDGGKRTNPSSDARWNATAEEQRATAETDDDPNVGRLGRPGGGVGWGTRNRGPGLGTARLGCKAAGDGATVTSPRRPAACM